jgi:acetyl esterase/lipase
MNYLSEPKGGWVIPVSISISETEKVFFESEVRTTLEKLAPDQELPDMEAVTVRGEWQGMGGDNDDADLNSKARFENVSEGTKDGPVILCLHGGGYFTGSAEMERTATFRLAQASGGRVFAVDYRLAPQSVFPAPLIDAIVAYKYLVDPPPEALHQPIDPKKLVIAGDSAGVSLLLNRILTQGWPGDCVDDVLGAFKVTPYSCGSSGSFSSRRLDRFISFGASGYWS